MEYRWQACHKVLVVRLDNLGDVLLATPAIHALRQFLPDARITLLTSPTGAQVDGLIPDLDDVIAYPAPWMDPDRTMALDPSREASTISRLRREGFDAAIIFTSYHQSSLPAAYLCYLAGIPLRHAASIDGPGSLLTSRHRLPDRPMHEVERGLDLVGGLGAVTSVDDLVLCPRPEDRQIMREFARSLREAGRPIVAIHAGSSCPSRAYPPDAFVQVARAVQSTFDAELLWTGSRAERDLVDQIQSELGQPGLNLAGHTNLSQLAALIAECDVAIAGNTGPMHVAAAVKTPVVALFALTNPPHEWHPWGVPYRLLNHPVPCAICYARVCPNQQRCLRDVPIDDVVRAVGDLLASRQSKRERG